MSGSVSILEFAQAEVVAVIDLLRVYLDEFNDYENENCVFFGMHGLIGPVQAWHRLQGRWEDALACCGAKHFHATDFDGNWGEFVGWSDYQKQRLMVFLTNIIRENLADFHLLGSAVFMSAYNRLPKYRSRSLRNPYFLCAVSAMSDATRLSHDFYGDKPIEFVFDQKAKHMQWINAAYDDVLLTKYGHLCAAKSQANHRHVSPVQVADFVAYEAGKYMQQRIKDVAVLGNKDLPPGELRWPMQKLTSLFWGSDTTLYNLHALMMVTDFWDNYKRSRRLIEGSKKIEETYDERKRRIQEIRQHYERIDKRLP